jgi:hypothetical protein
MALDPKTHKIYTVTANVTVTPSATGGRPERKVESGSFVVLEVAGSH